jgi:hypothetical protein
MADILGFLGAAGPATTSPTTTHEHVEYVRHAAAGPTAHALLERLLAVLQVAPRKWCMQALHVRDSQQGYWLRNCC